MNPGRLDRRIILQGRTLTQDDYGGRVETWLDLVSVWAELLPESASESNVADAERSVNRQRFRIRYIPIDSESTRINYKGAIYQITGITEERGRQSYLVVNTEKIGGLS